MFRALRAAFAIDDADYVLSLAGSQALRQLNSPGKSGSVFFLSGGCSASGVGLGLWRLSQRQLRQSR